VDERLQVTDSVLERVLIAVRPALLQRPPELRARQRPLLDQLAPGREQRLDVDPVELPAERARLVEPALADGLQRRPQAPRVPRRHEVQRAAHQCHAHRLAGFDQRAQRLRIEALDPRPQPDVRRLRHLRLHPDDALDRLAGARRPAPQQPLALEQRAIQGTRPEHLHGAAV
jgi:hypothetical protein